MYVWVCIYVHLHAMHLDVYVRKYEYVCVRVHAYIHKLRTSTNFKRSAELRSEDH